MADQEHTPVEQAALDLLERMMVIERRCKRLEFRLKLAEEELFKIKNKCLHSQ